MASDVTSLQSIQAEAAVPRRTCSRGVHLTAGLGGEALLAQSFSSPAGHRCGSLVVPRALLGLAGYPVDPRGCRLSAGLVIPPPCGDGASSPSASGHGSPSELRCFAPVGIPTSSHGIRPVRQALRASLPDSCVVRPHRPFIDMLSGVHSRHDVTIAPSAPGIPCQESCSDLVVSHHLVGLLRLRIAGLLHPAANRGVRRVSGSCLLLPGCTSLPRAVPTPRRIPLVHSRTVSPRPLPS